MGWLNLSRIEDPRPGVVFAVDKYFLEMDPVERDRMVKELTVQVLAEAYEIMLPTANIFTFWAPWIKRFYGGINHGPDELTRAKHIRFIWIDQDLKYELTGQRD